MQDRRRQFDEIFLQRAAGPYKGVNRVILALRQALPVCPDRRTILEPAQGQSRGVDPWGDPITYRPIFMCAT
jgi:hypothetical protein